MQGAHAVLRVTLRVLPPAALDDQFRQRCAGAAKTSREGEGERAGSQVFGQPSTCFRSNIFPSSQNECARSDTPEMRHPDFMVLIHIASVRRVGVAPSTYSCTDNTVCSSRNSRVSPAIEREDDALARLAAAEYAVHLAENAVHRRSLIPRLPQRDMQDLSPVKAD